MQTALQVAEAAARAVAEAEEAATRAQQLADAERRCWKEVQDAGRAGAGAGPGPSPRGSADGPLGVLPAAEGPMAAAGPSGARSPAAGEAAGWKAEPQGNGAEQAGPAHGKGVLRVRTGAEAARSPAPEASQAAAGGQRAKEELPSGSGHPRGTPLPGVLLPGAFQQPGRPGLPATDRAPSLERAQQAAAALTRPSSPWLGAAHLMLPEGLHDAALVARTGSPFLPPPPALRQSPPPPAWACPPLFGDPPGGHAAGPSAAHPAPRILPALDTAANTKVGRSSSLACTCA